MWRCGECGECVRAAAATPGAREENKSHSHYTHHHHHRHRAANARAAATRSLGTRAKLHRNRATNPPLLPALSEPATPLHRPALLSLALRGIAAMVVVAASQRAGFLLLLFDGAVGGGISRVPLARITRRSYGAVFLFAFPPCPSLVPRR